MQREQPSSRLFLQACKAVSYAYTAIATFVRHPYSTKLIATVI